jgi:serine/threonine protein kinase
MIKEMKISANSKPAGFLKDLPAGYGNLLEKILVFNPAKRMTIDEILNHEVVHAFHKP